MEQPCTLEIDGENTGCHSLVVNILNQNKDVTLRWQERGKERTYKITSFKSMRGIKIDTTAVANLTIKTDDALVLDSIYCLTNFVEILQGMYEGHETVVVGNSIKTSIQIGEDGNNFIKQAKELKDNAKLFKDLLMGSKRFY